MIAPPNLYLEDKKVVYCDHCFLALGEHENCIVNDDEFYHERCWDMLVRQHRLIRIRHRRAVSLTNICSEDD